MQSKILPNQEWRPRIESHEDRSYTILKINHDFFRVILLLAHYIILTCILIYVVDIVVFWFSLFQLVIGLWNCKNLFVYATCFGSASAFIYIYTYGCCLLLLLMDLINFDAASPLYITYVHLCIHGRYIEACECFVCIC